MSKKIYIDPGHGGVQPGAVKGSRKEKDDTLKMALKIKEYLKNQDCEVKLSRETDIDVDINDRCKDANSWGADYFLSIHRNSAGATATGNEIWIYSKATDITEAKARNLLNAVTKATGLKDRGVHKGAVSYSDYGVISNDSDNKVFDETLNETALALSKTLLSLVGAEWKDETIKGDVNGDGKVTAADARITLRASAQLETLTDEQKKAADMNGDSKVTAADSREILTEAAGVHDN